MNPIDFNYRKLRIAQDLNKKTLEAVGLKLMYKNENGIFIMPDDSTIAGYLNSLAEKQQIEHYRLRGEYGEIFLFDNDEVMLGLDIVKINERKIPDVIKIQCYDEKITSDDEIPLEISRIEELFKLPQTLFNSGTCIYFLCRKGKVVYVGQAENVHQRLVEHIKTKEFDAVFYLRIPLTKMNKIESALIAYLKPEYNKSSMKGDNKSKLLAESVLNVHGIHFNES